MGDTDRFQPILSVLEQRESQGPVVPCEARIVWYAAHTISSRQLRDTTEYR